MSDTSIEDGVTARDRSRPGVLYASYDGMLEPLGQSQVIAYLLPLAREYRIHLVSFEKPADLANEAAFAEMKALLEQGGIAWHPMTYHKWPPLLSTVWDLVRGAIACRRIAVREDLRILHGRSVLCGAMLQLARAGRPTKLLADIRGFWVDERIDGGIITRNGLTHCVLKPIERIVLRSADHIVTLTNASVPYLRSDPRFGEPDAPIDVIPTCANLSLFDVRGTLEREPFVLGYIGSLGTWYLLDEMLAFFKFVQEERPDARLLVINRGEHRLVRERAARAGIDANHIEIQSASHAEMPRQIARMSAGMALIKPCFSKIASAPTKVAEYLGCGVPVVGNNGVGDMESLLESAQVGISLTGFDDVEMRAGARRLIDLCAEEGLEQRCRAAAESRYSLQRGIEGYRAIYERLASSTMQLSPA